MSLPITTDASELPAKTTLGQAINGCGCTGCVANADYPVMVTFLGSGTRDGIPYRVESFERNDGEPYVRLVRTEPGHEGTAPWHYSLADATRDDWVPGDHTTPPVATDAPAGESATIPALFPVGTRVAFAPDINGRYEGTVAQHVEAGVAHQGYGIDVDNGGRIHRWHDYGGERVTLARDTPATVPDLSELTSVTYGAAVLRAGQHFVWLAGTSRGYLAEPATHDGGIYRVLTPMTDTGWFEYELVGESAGGNRVGAKFNKYVNSPGVMVHVFRTEQTDAEPTEPADEDKPVNVIPRTNDDALAMIGALRTLGLMVPRSAEMIDSLQTIRRYLPGGELNARGHELAAQVNLCGEYEAITCPTFGWTPRNGEGSSMMRQTELWRQTVERFEQSNADMSPADQLARYATVYDRGGDANRAVVEHAENHLEHHKRASVNELIDELDWDLIDGGESDYDVTIRVERRVTQYQYVTLTRRGSDGDDAAQSIDRYELADYVDSDSDSWETIDPCDSDFDDWEVTDTEPTD